MAIAKTVLVSKADGAMTSILFTLGKKDRNQVNLSWTMNDLNINGEATADDYFDCLLQIREIFEKTNMKILCNGARYDVYPSRMSRQMGKGIKAYAVTMGKQAMEDSLVDIFESADLVKIGTIQQQRDYYNDWLDSLG